MYICRIKVFQKTSERSMDIFFHVGTYFNKTFTMGYGPFRIGAMRDIDLLYHLNSLEILSNYRGIDSF